MFGDRQGRSRPVQRPSWLTNLEPSAASEFGGPRGSEFDLPHFEAHCGGLVCLVQMGCHSGSNMILQFMLNFIKLMLHMLRRARQGWCHSWCAVMISCTWAWALLPWVRIGRRRSRGDALDMLLGLGCGNDAGSLGHCGLISGLGHTDPPILDFELCRRLHLGAIEPCFPLRSCTWVQWWFGQPTESLQHCNQTLALGFQ